MPLAFSESPTALDAGDLQSIPNNGRLPRTNAKTEDVVWRGGFTTGPQKTLPTHNNQAHWGAIQA
ncbi:hypothetical protein N7486_000548 [Penicillium sp. IBT 16267x]|nr:hypothetical protein N7486_000548 [Penicillium sp. IBT 16267x]